MTKHRSPTLITLGRLVRTFRDAAGVTQKGLASALGYTNGWVSNVENGQLRPRPEQVTALEQELGAPPGALMNVYEQLDGESLPGWFREWVDGTRVRCSLVTRRPLPSAWLARRSWRGTIRP
jgi:transcriptional regulator with XRE-family HTH domain